MSFFLKKTKTRKNFPYKYEKVRQWLGKKKFDPYALLSISSLLIFCVLIISVCFIGLSPRGPLPNQTSRIRIIADVPFSYKSTILTEKAQKKTIKRIPPIFELDKITYQKFETYIHKLAKNLDPLAEQIKDMEQSERLDAITKFKQKFEPDSGYDLNTETLDRILRLENKSLYWLQEGLLILHDIYDHGIYNPTNLEIQGNTDSIIMLNFPKSGDTIATTKIQSQSQAIAALLAGLRAFNLKHQYSTALFHLLRLGVTPNLKYAEKKHEELRKQAAANVKPVIIEIEQGESIIESGSKVSPLDFEKLNAFYQKRKETKGEALFDELFCERFIMTLLFLICTIIFIKTHNLKFSIIHQKLILSSTVILMNLAIIRLVIELAENSPPLLTVLPYLVPTVVGAIIVTILIGTGPGILTALVVCFLNALMQGNSIPILLMTFSSALAGIYFCRNIQIRTRVVQAGALAGLCLAICALFPGIYQRVELTIIAQQMLTALGIGTISGVAVIGFLPVLEKIFKYTTDITLLELTNYNHPLLRRMQMEAPGSYHHSLMVANLAERASIEVDANPLICRTCSLYHDIGKLIKPEYFTENQRQKNDPHIDQNPSMSALVIKSHIKEGIHLAKQYKLPKLIIDVIEQHHGNSLIEYFYYKAIEKQKKKQLLLFPEPARIEIDRVNEHTYRYQGPQPQFKESAIILLADSVEAASRSLTKVSPQAIDELLEKIILSRIQDYQLSQSPLTFEELTKIKKSFAFTLLNMLHTRVQYPQKEKYNLEQK
jgi:cyclic-di-AMP phosphodiesterase PgpH